MLRLRPLQGLWTAAKTVFAIVVGAAMVGPLIVVVVASFTTTRFVVFPPQGFTLHWYAEALADPDFSVALAFSVWLAVVSTLTSTALSLLLALALRILSARGEPIRAAGPLTAVLRTIGVLPLLLPAIVVAVSLLTLLSGLGLSGSALGFVIAHTVVSLPFTLVMVEIGLANVQDDVLQAARVLGAGPIRALSTITLPLAAGGIAAALAFGFILSFGEFTVSVFLQSASYTTIPVAIYNALYNTPLGPNITAMSGVVAIVTLLCMGVGFALLRISGRKGL